MLLEILACPSCKGPLEYRQAQDELVCHACHLTYEIRDDIPIMLIDSATGDRQYLNERLALLAPDLSLLPRRSPTMRPEPAHSLDAVVFPWSVMVDDGALKRALLYFDRVGILGPPESELDSLIESIRDREIQSDRFPRRQREAFVAFFTELRYLVDAGAVELVDAGAILRDAPRREQVRAMVASEAFSPELGRAVLEMGVLSSILGSPKVGYEPNVLRHGRLLLHEMNKTREVAIQYWTDGPAMELVEDLFLETDARLSTLPPEFQHFVRARGDLDKALLVSIFCNAALAAIDKYQSVPVMTGAFGVEYLSMKYRRALGLEAVVASAKGHEAMSELAIRTDTRSGILASMTLELTLADVAALSYQDILDAREAHGDSLARFRFEMTRLASSIKATKLDRELYGECREVLARDVLPALRELEAELRQSKISRLRSMLSVGNSIGPTVPFVVSAFAPIPIFAAALVSAGILTLEAALELRSAEVTHKNNGLAYVFEVSHKSLPTPSEMWSRHAEMGARFVGGPG